MASVNSRYARPLYNYTQNCGDPADAGATVLSLGEAPPGTLGTATTVVIRYKRNEAVQECAENAALDDAFGSSLDDSVTEYVRSSACGSASRLNRKQIIKTHAAVLQPNRRIVFDFETRAGGVFHVVLSGDEPMGFEHTFAGPEFPPVPISSLRWTHRLIGQHTLYLVTQEGGGSVQVFKEADHMFKKAGDDAPLVDLSLLASLAQTDVVLPPTNVVLDDLGRFHGILMDYHPASSLKTVLGSGATRSLPWTVKLIWACDIAAGLAWLHSQNIVWGGMETSNIILCSDGRCRLIDYCPEGLNTSWYNCRLEYAWGPYAPDDVAALGLVLWCLAMGRGWLPWEGEPLPKDLELNWDETIPSKFQQLVASSLTPSDGAAFSANAVHAALVTLLPA